MRKSLLFLLLLPFSLYGQETTSSSQANQQQAPDPASQPVAGNHQFNQNIHGPTEGYGNDESTIRETLSPAQLKELDGYVNPLHVQDRFQEACQKAREDLNGEGRVIGGKKIKFEDGKTPCDTDQQELAQVFGPAWDRMVTVATQMIPMVMGSMGLGADVAGSKFLTEYGKLKRQKKRLDRKIKRKKKNLKSLKKVDPDNAAIDAQESKIAEYETELEETSKDIEEKGKNNKGETKEKKDLCKYIPIASQISTGVMQAQQARATLVEAPEPGPGDEFRDQFYQTAQMHKSRKVTSYVQAGTWLGTGTCYAVYAATGAQLSAMDYASKIGATLFLGWFYAEKAKRHQIIQKVMQKTGDEFNIEKGECHPLTDRACYCRHDERATDPVCQPKLFAERANRQNIPTSCIDSKLESDPNCNCRTNNSCFDVVYKQALNLNGMPQSFHSQNDPFYQMSRGSLGSALFSPGAMGGNRAVLKRKLAQLLKKAPKKMGRGPLSSSQQASAKLLAQAGLPLKLARHLARQPSDNKLKKALMGSVPRKYYRHRRQSKRKAKAKSADYAPQRQKSWHRRSRKNQSNRRRTRRVGSINKNEVLRFAERANEKAQQIRPDKSVPIWKIISIRYQKSSLHGKD
jgi:hypothetical protein